MNPFQWMALGCMYAFVIWAQATYLGLSVWESLDPNKWEKQ